jgi:hypothetical protein
MINEYISKLMENLPESITKRETPIKIDLILGGGAFNGSYILGALYFLKELERKNYIIIKRISTCSISSILALLYLTDNLEKVNELYFSIIQDFRCKGNLSKLFEFKELLKKYITDESETCKLISKKLFICYNNISSGKKHVINKYKNFDVLFDTITRSCFVPFIIDFHPCYKDKYIDGIIPYFFKSKKNKRIYLDVYTLDKLVYAINIKNEQNNYHRLFEGILDIHKFFIKECNTTMCSDLDHWSIYNYTTYYIYIIVEKITLIVMYLVSYIKASIFKNNYNKLKPMIEKTIKTFLEYQCF